MALLLTGILLTGASWMLAWSHIGVVSEHTFFPLWLGYVLTINGLSELAIGDSLLRRMGYGFVLLFLVSVPFWWLFEFLNSIVKNWHYIFPHPISNLQYVIEASVDFSTVVPAVLSTVFVLYQLWKRKSADTITRAIHVRRETLILVVLLGIALLLLVWVVPNETFPLVWIAPILIIEPLLYLSNYPSLIRKIQTGEWRLLAAIMIGTLFVGFWWECWNFFSMPKWIYTVPYVGFWKVFEMPLLGYLGYPFFGIIVFSFTVFALFHFSGSESRLARSVAQAFDLT